MGGLSIWHWLIVLVIVILVFGTKRLKNVGKDLGEAIKGFKKGVHDDDDADRKDDPTAQLSESARDDELDPARRDDRTAPRGDAASGERKPPPER